MDLFTAREKEYFKDKWNNRCMIAFWSLKAKRYFRFWMFIVRVYLVYMCCTGWTSSYVFFPFSISCCILKFYSIFLYIYVLNEVLFSCYHRCKIKEDLTSIKHSVVEKQGEWHKKWKEFLGLSPFSLIKGWTPVSNVDLPFGE